MSHFAIFRFKGNRKTRRIEFSMFSFGPEDQDKIDQIAWAEFSINIHSRVIPIEKLKEIFTLIDAHPKCDGCRYGALGQRDHMEYNGCLYTK